MRCTKTLKDCPTLQQLIDAGCPLNLPITLKDPDTYWSMKPSFTWDETEITISAEYNEDELKED